MQSKDFVTNLDLPHQLVSQCSIETKTHCKCFGWVWGGGAQKDPVVPAFPDLHLAPASILKELAPYFHRLSAQMRLIGLPLPHELNGKEAAEYPPYNVAIGLHGALEIHRIMECHG